MKLAWAVNQLQRGSEAAEGQWVVEGCNEIPKCETSCKSCFVEQKSPGSGSHLRSSPHRCWPATAVLLNEGGVWDVRRKEEPVILCWCLSGAGQTAGRGWVSARHPNELGEKRNEGTKGKEGPHLRRRPLSYSWRSHGTGSDATHFSFTWYCITWWLTSSALISIPLFSSTHHASSASLSSAPQSPLKP